MSRGLVRATSIVALLTVLSRLLGFFREQIIAWLYGAGTETDAYAVALTLASVLILSLAALMQNSVLSVFARRYQVDRKQAWRLLSNYTNVTFAVAGVGSVAAAIFSPFLITYTAPGAPKAVIDLAVDASRILLPLSGVALVSAVHQSVLTYFKDVVTVALGPMIQSAMIVLFVLFRPESSASSMALGWGLGSLLTLIIQIPRLYRLGYSYELVVDLRDPDMRQSWRLLRPMLLTMPVSQAATFLNRVIASGLPTGSIAAYAFADRLRHLPTGFVQTVVNATVYPALVEAATNNRNEDVNHHFESSLRLVAIILTPISVLMVFLAPQIVRLVYEHGNFDAAATQGTAAGLKGLMIGAPLSVFVYVLAGVFHAHQLPRLTVYVGTVSTSMSIIGMWLLGPRLGIWGLALADALGYVAGLLLSLILGIKKLPQLAWSVAIRGAIVPAAIAIVPMSGSLLLAAHLMGLFRETYPIVGLAVRLCFTGSLACAVYYVTIWKLGVPEVRILQKSLLDRIGSRWKKVES